MNTNLIFTVGLCVGIGCGFFLGVAVANLIYAWIQRKMSE